MQYHNALSWQIRKTTVREVVLYIATILKLEIHLYEGEESIMRRDKVAKGPLKKDCRMQSGEAALERGGIETALSSFCLCITNSSIAESCAIISYPKIPTERLRLQFPELLFCSNINLWSALFVATPPLQRPMSSAVLHRSMTEGRVAVFIQKLAPPDTCHLGLKS